MTDWDLLTPGIGLTSIGIVGVGISLAGVAKTFIDGMHAVSLLTMLIGMIFLASGLFKDGFPSTGRAKSATFITLGFLVTFGFAAAVTVSGQIPSIYAYIGIMLIISIPATVLAVASYRQVPYLKALAVIFVSAAVVGGTTFYAFGLVAPSRRRHKKRKKRRLNRLLQPMLSTPQYWQGLLLRTIQIMILIPSRSKRATECSGPTRTMQCTVSPAGRKICSILQQSVLVPLGS